MIIIIPLGGTGSRFKENGYNKPKALINVFGIPIIFWLLNNLKVSNEDTIFIPYNKEYINYRFEDFLLKNYPNLNFKFLILNNNTRGAAETLNIALKTLDIKDQPIISLDSDNFYTVDILSLWKLDNSVITFNDTNNKPIYSYVSVNEKNQITKIVEKDKISNNACCGGYAFKSYKELLKYTQIIIDNNIRSKDEFYISTAINEMVKNNIIFNNINISKDNFICLGTPLQLRYFYNNFPKISCNNFENKLKELRVCFDLDNTLVTFPRVKNDYTTVEPITKNIEFLKYLKNFNHTIIIYTARRMKTSKGNTGKVMADIGKITFDTLEKFNIPYDELYFGKPYADVYIDDLALNCFDDIEKNFGFYLNNIKPRDFNTINSHTLDIYKKESNDLSGEIYYYNNIIREVKDLFPLFIDFDDNNKWYKIEKINGVCASILYTSELLDTNILYSIMDSIKRLQNVTYTESKNINIYNNYAKKMEKRYNSYDYSKFKNYDTVYKEIITFVKKYEELNMGKKTVIHGDTVLTNIIINNFNKVKFIDMRGKIGDELSICGDWLYDWAKLYQSLIGYDYILQNKIINDKYQKKLITIFSNYFIELYSEKDLSNLKIITKSLLFTLLPLHDNDNCYKFYNLIFSEYLF